MNINNGSHTELSAGHEVDLSRPLFSLDERERSLVERLSISQKEKMVTTRHNNRGLGGFLPNEKIPWSLDRKNLTLQSRNIADWNLQDAQNLARYLEHPLNAVESVNFGCFSGWDPFASNVQPEVYISIMESLGRMPRLQSISLDCRGIPLSKLPTSLLHLPRLEIHRVDISLQDAAVFARALSQQEYDQKYLSFHSLDDWSVANLFVAFKQYPMDTLEKMETIDLGPSGVKTMSEYLRECSPPGLSLVLRNNTWSKELFGYLVTSLIAAPANGVTKLRFHHASFPPDSALLWQQLFQEKNNLQALSFIDLVGNDQNRWNEGLVRALETAKLPESLTTLDLVHSLHPPRPPHSLAFVLPRLLERNPQIRALNLPTNLEGLQDTAIIPIARALATTAVERLDLSNARFTPVGLRTVIQYLPSTMKHLNLSRVQIADDSAELLGMWLSRPQCCIEELILDWCQLTPLGLDLIFGSLTTNPETSKLQKLSLQWCEPLGVNGWMLLTQYLPKLPESLVDLSFGSFPSSLRVARENTNPAHREREKLQSRILRNQVVEILRGQTFLRNIQLQLDHPIASYAEYFARRNQFLQHDLYSEKIDSSWQELLHQLQATQATIPEDKSDAFISTSLVERAFHGSIYACTASNGARVNTYDWELSLLYDFLSQRPDWIAAR